jgi:hypothetical protein
LIKQKGSEIDTMKHIITHYQLAKETNKSKLSLKNVYNFINKIKENKDPKETGILIHMIYKSLLCCRLESIMFTKILFKKFTSLKVYDFYDVLSNSLFYSGILSNGNDKSLENNYFINESTTMTFVMRDKKKKKVKDYEVREEEIFDEENFKKYQNEKKEKQMKIKIISNYLKKLYQTKDNIYYIMSQIIKIFKKFNYDFKKIDEYFNDKYFFNKIGKNEDEIDRKKGEMIKVIIEEKNNGLKILNDQKAEIEQKLNQLKREKMQEIKRIKLEKEEERKREYQIKKEEESKMNQTSEKYTIDNFELFSYINTKKKNFCANVISKKVNYDYSIEYYYSNNEIQIHYENNNFVVFSQKQTVVHDYDYFILSFLIKNDNFEFDFEKFLKINKDFDVEKYNKLKEDYSKKKLEFENNDDHDILSDSLMNVYTKNDDNVYHYKEKKEFPETESQLREVNEDYIKIHHDEDKNNEYKEKKKEKKEKISSICLSVKVNYTDEKGKIEKQSYNLNSIRKNQIIFFINDIYYLNKEVNAKLN